MRIVEKILGGIGGLLALILLFILVCHLNPSIAEMIGEQIQVQNQVGMGENVQQVDTLVQEQDSISVSTEDTPSTTDATEMEELERLRIPSKVAGRTGYTPIEASGVQITPQEAETVAQTVGVGNIGEDLTYEEIMYPYYYMLDDVGKAMYRQIHANSNDVTSEFAPVETDVTAKQLDDAFTAVCNDHPELFWLNTAYSYQYTPDGKIAKITLSYNFTANNLDTAKADFNSNANEIIYGTRGIGSDYDKEVFVHDALLDQISYDLNAPINQSAYSALVQNRTVCAGYARAFQYIMQQLGIPCYYCTGYAGENHAWNIIKLEDDYYNVDTTWDDTDPNTYDYFNCSDEDYKNDHVRQGLSVNLPPCLGSKYSDLEINPEDRVNTTPVVTEPEETEDDTTNTGTTVPTEQIDINLVVATYGDDTVLGNIEAYYFDCQHRLVESTRNHYSFDNIVIDENLWNSIKKSYEDGSYNNAYMERVLAEKHAGNATLTITAQKLDNGTYRIHHDIRIS